MKRTKNQIHLKLICHGKKRSKSFVNKACEKATPGMTLFFVLSGTPGYLTLTTGFAKEPIFFTKKRPSVSLPMSSIISLYPNTDYRVPSHQIYILHVYSPHEPIYANPHNMYLKYSHTFLVSAFSSFQMEHTLNC